MISLKYSHPGDDLEDLVFAFVENEEGREAPLTEEQDRRVRQLLMTDSDVRRMAAEFRATNQTIAAIVDTANVDVPTKLISMIQEFDVNRDQRTDDVDEASIDTNIVKLEPKRKRLRQPYLQMAAAASVAAVFVAGGFQHHHGIQRMELETRLEKAQSAIESADYDSKQALSVQEGLHKKVAVLEEENEALRQLSSSRSLLTSDIADAPATTVAQSSQGTEQFEQRMAELTGALVDRDQQLEAAKMQLQGAIGRELAATQQNERIADLEATHRDSLTSMLAIKVTNNRLTAQVDEYRQQADWRKKVVDYHRGYAGTNREVEISAEDQRDNQALTAWFGNMMGKDFTVPDLSGSGLTFLGGRLFFANGKPIGQIAYHDEEGRLAGFCFTVNEDAAEQAPKVEQDGDLNLVSWNKRGIDYVVVGWTDTTTLEAVANDLHQEYGDNI